MATEGSPHLQFPGVNGKPLFSARVGWARVNAAEAVKKDWERLTTAARKILEGQPLVGAPADGSDALDPGFSSFLDAPPPQQTSHERPDILESPPEFPDGLVGSGGSGQDAAVPSIGIVGAGSAGLFTAMILQYLKANAVDDEGKKFDYKCDIIEASDIVGGRLKTHSFNEAQKDLYYDVGAMRYPENTVMQRTFDLFKYIGMNPAKSLDTAELGQLVPYYMTNMNGGEQLEYFAYNDVVQCGDVAKIMTLNNNDPFKMSVDKLGIDPGVLGKDPGTVMNDAIKMFRDQLDDNLGNAWAWMMSFDKLTARQFLAGDYVPPPNVKPQPTPPNYNFETVEWLENFNGGSGWYDQALSEVVLESLDFDEPKKGDKPWQWYCIFGGSVQLANNMKTWLKDSANFKFKTRVSAISSEGPQYPVTVKTSAGETLTYDAVFNSTTLSTLKLMDISGLQSLPYATKEAIRCLSYGPSAKIGLVFTTPWWQSLKPNPILSGGLGHSDLNIRTCVYPSYNIGQNAKKEKEFVLLCSYTWQADALRLGAWIGNDSMQTDLVNLVLRDLARMHSSSEQPVDELLKIITSAYSGKCYAHDWTHDPNTAGAFAFFSAGQFANLWPQLTRANSSPNFFIIGELASAHHAWVVGALESAVAGVYQWLTNNPSLPGVSGPNGALALLETSKKGNPFVGLPDYMETTVMEWNRRLNMLEATITELEKSMDQLQSK